MNYALHLCIYVFIFGIASMGLNVTVGYCGRLTMSQGAFFGIGAYAYSIAALRFGASYFLAIAISVVVGCLASLLVSFVASRMKGDHFMLVSLAMGVLAVSVFANWFKADTPFWSWDNLVNGPFGLSGIPGASAFGFRAKTVQSSFCFAAIVFATAALGTWLLLRSPWGRMLKAIRDDELAAQALGKNIGRAQIESFAVSCGLLALSGALYASYVGYVDPSSASLDQAILFLAMLLIGGSGTFWGALSGALLVVMLPELARLIHFSDTIAASLRALVFGLVLVVLMHVRPQGLIGEYKVD